MSIEVVKRLPKVRSLSQILPKGAEGGKEFSRIIDLLLTNESRQRGDNATIFDDSAGDYGALDSIVRIPSGTKRVGYQYKFFPSPLSNQHRANIKQSLDAAATGSRDTKIDKWIIVTPDDLTNSARRKDGGDVSWFSKLSESYPNFEIEHYGHTKLVNLFMQAPYLALYYYPELVLSGQKARTSLETMRKAYDAAIVEHYGRIEFVGMSVYKEEATKGVPLEKIYIPLSLVGEDQDDSEDHFPRQNPLKRIKPGLKSVILGDPGSGKSTLLSFLALSRTSTAVQKSFGIESLGELPVIVTLRRYTDELKTRSNLSIMDFIVETTRADFSLNSCSDEFFEFFLENGRAVVMFDGLDELPNSLFKRTVRDRIRSFSVRYPQVAVITTSRIVGYEGDARFDARFGHFRMARLRLTEIEKFISDWYRARIENENERRANVADLIRIISNPDSAAIRDLARNPLLLTIVALVHRIDAVLPDERVVLYQKCTETLLNTWYRWKFRDEDEKSRGRIERRNRRRIEAIAYWMQQRSVDAERGRAVVPLGELKAFLKALITDNERVEAEEAEYEAEDFLAFVKSRTGLLIEVGDGQYSFLHLTFQEYLAATYLISQGEVEGVSKIWDMIGPESANPRWHEVIRLLIASLKSVEAQSFFLTELLGGDRTGKTVSGSLLLGGLVLDGIEPAEEAAPSIFKSAFGSALDATSSDDLRALERLFRAWIQKDPANSAVASEVYAEVRLENAAQEIDQISAGVILGLERHALLGEKVLQKRAAILGCEDEPELRILRALKIPARRISELHDIHDALSLNSPKTNLYAAVSIPILVASSSRTSGDRIYRRMLLLTLSLTAHRGPYGDYGWNVLSVAGFSGSASRRSAKNGVAAETVSSTSRLRKAEASLSSFFEEQTRLSGIPVRSAGRVARRRHLHDDIITELDDRLQRLSSDSGEDLSRKFHHRREELDDMPDVARGGIDINQRASQFWLQVRTNSTALRTIASCVAQDLGITESVVLQELVRSRLLPQTSSYMAALLGNDAQLHLAQLLSNGEKQIEAEYHASFLILVQLWSDLHSRSGTMFSLAPELKLALGTHSSLAVRVANAVTELCLRDDAEALAVHAKFLEREIGLLRGAMIRAERDSRQQELPLRAPTKRATKVPREQKNA